MSPSCGTRPARGNAVKPDLRPGVEGTRSRLPTVAALSPRMWWAFLLPPLLALSAQTLQSSQSHQSATFAVVGGTVVDGTGREPIEEGHVVMDGDRLTCVGTPEECPLPDGTETLDAQGRWVVPGLVDAHVHFSQSGWVDGRPDALDLREEHPYPEVVAELRSAPERFFRTYLCSGVTAVFDVGGYPWTFDLRDAPQPRPDLAVAGPLLSTRDHWVNLPAERQFVHISDEGAVEEAVAYLSSRGSDAVKVWYLAEPGSADEERFLPLLQRAGELAEARGIPLIVHATALETAKDAIRAGAHLLVHSVRDQEVDTEFLELALAAGTIYNPTLVVHEGYHEIRARHFRDTRYPLDCVDSVTFAKARSTQEIPGGLEPEDVAASARDLERQSRLLAENLLRVHEAGIPVAMGTDAGNPLTLHGPSVHHEMEAMVDAGMTPMEVLVASTRNGARAMGREDVLGTLEAGKRAHLLVLDSDPTESVAAFRDMSHLVVGGRLHTPAEFLPVDSP